MKILWRESHKHTVLTLFRMGGRGGAKKPPPPTSFSPATSANVRMCPENFMTDWCKILSLYLVPVQLQPTLTPPSEKSSFYGQIFIKLML